MNGRRGSCEMARVETEITRTLANGFPFHGSLLMRPWLLPVAI
jgi:hypothetical protein